jgi:hypothetical protein
LKRIIKRFIGPKAIIIDYLRKMVQWDTNEKSRFIEELRSNPTSYRVKPTATEKIYLILKKYTEEDYVQFLFKNLNDFLEARDELIKKEGIVTDQHGASATGLASVLYQSSLFQFILKIPTEQQIKVFIISKRYRLIYDQ